MALSKLTDIRKSLSVEIEDLQVNGITTFTGSVSIGGTLTYEDVTNIDSIGIITARSGIKDQTLTSGRVVYVDSDKTLTDSANLVFDGNKFGVNRSGTLQYGISFAAAALDNNRIGWHDGSSSKKAAIGVDDSDDSLNLYTGASTTGRVRISSTGNVGINQSSPRTTLDVSGYVYLGNGGQIQITGSAGAKGLQLAGADDGDNIIGTMGSSGENLLFRTASSERMRLLVGGPHLLLGGSASVNEITESSANAGMVIGGTGFGNGGLAIINSTTGTGRIYFGDATGSDAARNRGQINYYHSGDYMLFATAGSERLRIESDGNIRLADTTDNIVHTSHDASRIRLFGGSVESVNNGATLSLNGISHSAGNFADLSAATGGHVQFRIGTSEKLRITSSNITTSSSLGHLLLGTDTARTFNTHSGRLQVTGTTYSHSTISVINNEANGNGAYIFLGKQRSGAVGGSTAVQANDLIGELRFPAGDGTDMDNYAARIIVSADANASSNNTAGRIDIYTTRRNGSPHFKARIGQNSNHGTQFSFGTESSDLNNTSTPDRTSLKVGPATHIEGVFGHNGTPGMYYNCYSGGNTNFYRGTRAPSGGDWRPAAYGQKYGGHYFFGDPSSTAYSAQQQITTMQTNMTISREGYIRKQYQPAFDAVRTSGTVPDAANQRIVFNSALTNVGSHYNTSNGYFTAPTAGTYFFSMHGMNNNQLAWYNFRKNGSVINPQHGAYQTNGTDWSSVSMTIVIVLAANDTMAVHTGNSNSVGMYGTGNNHNGFCGYMLG